MSALLDISVVDGWLLWVLGGTGVVGLCWLLCKPSRRFLLVVAPIAIAVAVLLTLLARWIVEDVWAPFPEPIPTAVYLWSGLVLIAIALLIARITVTRGVWPKILTVLAALLVALLGLAHINASFDEFSTVRAVLGLQSFDTTDLASVQGGRTIALVDWQTPYGLQTNGEVTEAPIPATKSQFSARSAQVYLPPAYFADPRPRLPVLVLVAGQPGSPSDWLLSADLPQTMDDFAAQHGGVSPVVIMADGTGTEIGNPLCMDSRLGNAATYLTDDVAAWAAGELDVETDRSKWAIGGLSYGGTCALQLATTRPDMYPTFLSMSAQVEPTLGNRQSTVAQAFGGDESKFVAVNPVDLLQKNKFPQVGGAFVVGTEDKAFGPGVRHLYDLAQQAGMDVRLSTPPGGHSFRVWSAGLHDQLPWIAGRLGIHQP